ncbi:MAG: hypothetical protein Q8L52_01695 [bacterium]|nr:hypothetical protein [bacterium]
MENKSSANVGILGNGEIGSSLSKFFENPKIKDLNRDDGLLGVEVLHICIPWSDNFIEIARKEIKEANPKLTIIHATVAPGTVKNIGGMVVHSPVRGVHPNLYEGIKTFVKYIGADSEDAAKMAEDHLNSLGIKTKTFYPSITTELGKILDTTYYGIVIAWHGEMKEICDKFGVDFEKAVTDFNKTYNEGYTKLDKKNVIRPVFYPPQFGKPKHCIVPNATILEKYYKSPIFELLLKKYKDKL